MCAHRQSRSRVGWSAAVLATEYCICRQAEATRIDNAHVHTAVCINHVAPTVIQSVWKRPPLQHTAELTNGTRRETTRTRLEGRHGSHINTGTWALTGVGNAGAPPSGARRGGPRGTGTDPDGDLLVLIEVTTPCVPSSTQAAIKPHCDMRS